MYQKFEHLRQRAGDDAEVCWDTGVTGRRENCTAGTRETNHRVTAAAYATQVSSLRPTPTHSHRLLVSSAYTAGA